MQVSAKTNDNIEKMFREMGLKLIAADPNVSALKSAKHDDQVL